MTFQLAKQLSVLPFRFKDKNRILEKKQHFEKLQLLKNNIEASKKAMLSAQENFNNVVEPKLIDFYIYKIQSEQSRYAQLLLEYREEEKKSACFEED